MKNKKTMKNHLPQIFQKYTRNYQTSAKHFLNISKNLPKVFQTSTRHIQQLFQPSITTLLDVFRKYSQIMCLMVFGRLSLVSGIREASNHKTKKSVFKVFAPGRWILLFLLIGKQDSWSNSIYRQPSGNVQNLNVWSKTCLRGPQ